MKCKTEFGTLGYGTRLTNGTQTARCLIETNTLSRGDFITTQEYKIEHRHIYETRLGIMGLSANDYPTANQHNMAVIEADAHIAAIKKQEREDGLKQLQALKRSL